MAKSDRDIKREKVANNYHKNQKRIWEIGNSARVPIKCYKPVSDYSYGKSH